MFMKTVLISSIFRNSEKSLSRYHQQLKLLVKDIPEYRFRLSLYENDSIDNTKEIIDSLDWNFLDDISIIKENINTTAYGSVMVEDRVKNLAFARNKTLEAKNFLNESDYVLSIEADITYDSLCIKRLLWFKENFNVDIISAASFFINKSGKKKLYDQWATRRTADEEIGNLLKSDKEQERYYSTFNCVCLYDAEPLKQGIRFHWYNDRLKKFDCDTAVICEKFHEKGRHEIYIDHLAECWHSR